MGNFVQIPNDTVRDKRLSYIARGLLAEALSNDPDKWRQEGAKETWKRARAERGDRAEGLIATRAGYAELEQFGYRHRLTWRGPTGRENKITYSLTPSPCGDPRCRSAGCGVTEPYTHNDLGEQGVSAGRPEYTVSGGSGTVYSSEHHQAEHNQKNSVADVEAVEPMCDYGDDWRIECIECHQLVVQAVRGDLWDDNDTPHVCFSSVPLEARRAAMRLVAEKAAARGAVAGRVAYAKPQRVTEAEAQRWQQDRDAGLSPYAISAKYGRPVTTIYAHTTKKEAPSGQ